MPLKTAIEEIIHGVAVNDPYRWLEDRALPETDVWIREQQQRSNAYFSMCPELSAIESRVVKYLDVEVLDQPARVGDRYFFRKRRKGQEQGSICAREETCGTERVLVDPAKMGAFASASIYRISPDASLLAYEVKHGGGDCKEIRILDVNGASIFLTVSRQDMHADSPSQRMAISMLRRPMTIPRSIRSAIIHSFRLHPIMWCSVFRELRAAGLS